MLTMLQRHKLVKGCGTGKASPSSGNSPGPDDPKPETDPNT